MYNTKNNTSFINQTRASKHLESWNAVELYRPTGLLFCVNNCQHNKYPQKQENLHSFKCSVVKLHKIFQKWHLSDYLSVCQRLWQYLIQFANVATFLVFFIDLYENHNLCRKFYICQKNIIWTYYYHYCTCRFNEVESQVYWFHLVGLFVSLSICPSVLWIGTCSLCIFNNSRQIHFIFTYLIKQFQKVCLVQGVFSKYKNLNFWLWLCLVLTWDAIWIDSMGNHRAAGGILKMQVF